MVLLSLDPKFSSHNFGDSERRSSEFHIHLFSYWIWQSKSHIERRHRVTSHTSEYNEKEVYLDPYLPGWGQWAIIKAHGLDPDIVECFESRVWVRLDRKICTYTEIARRVLAQLNPADSDKLVTQEDEQVSRDLQKSLEGKRCFIVLDDVWDNVIRHEMDLPYRLRGSRVLLTTRLLEVAEDVSYNDDLCMLKMWLMNKNESWHLFCAKVFGEELCPRELVKPGKKIVEKCEGLPLLIVTIANLLSKKEKSPEYWNKVAQDKKN
ncbi:hypothetical protein ACS0TY_001217 [Phlomoides rotata]